MTMKFGKISLLLLGFSVFCYAVVLILFFLCCCVYVIVHFLRFVFVDGYQIAVPETCPAANVGKCGDPDDWEGEFFPGISKIKYEVNFLFEFFLFL